MDKSNRLVETTASFVILWGLLVIVFFRPLISGITWNWSNTYSQILILFILAVWILRMAVKGEFIFRRTSLGLPIFLFLLSLIISIFNSVNKDVSFNQLYQFLSYPVLYFIIVNNLQEKLTPRQATVLLFSLTFTAALAVTVWLRRIGIPSPLALFPPLAVILVSIPVLRISPKVSRGKSIDIHSILLPLMLVVAILVSLYGIYQRYWGLEQTRQMIQMHSASQFPPNFLARLGVNKVFSTFVFPPALAGYLILILPLSLTLLIYAKSGWRRVLPGLTLIVGGACLYFTYSKGGWVSFILSMAFLIFILGRKHRRLFFISFPIIISLFLILVFSGILPYISLQGFMDSFRVRIDYWKGGLEMLKDYPLFGSGLGTFGSLYARYKLAGAEETQLAHNNYLQLWIETGILGIISFLWLWGAFLRAGWRTIKDELQVIPLYPYGHRRAQAGTGGHRRAQAGYTLAGTGGLQEGMVVGCYVGVVAFLIHSLVDFDLYVQGIATYVWLFMGMVMVRESSYKFKVTSLKLTNVFIQIMMVTTIVSAIVFLMITVRKPMVAERHYQESFIYLSQGATEKGVRHLKEAILLNPRKGAYYYRLGSVYQNKGLLDEAIGQYRKAIKRNPFMPYYHSTLGKTLWDRAKGQDKKPMDEAVREFEKARDYYPTKANYRLLLGWIYELRGRKEEAIQQYNKALELDSSLEEARIGIERLQPNSLSSQNRNVLILPK